MSRALHALIIAAYVMTGVVVAAALIRVSQAPPELAWIVAALLALSAAHVHALAARRTEDQAVSADLEVLRTVNGLLVDELDATRARLDAVEARLETESTSRHAHIVSEMRTLEDLVRRMGADMEVRIRDAKHTAESDGEPDAADRAKLLATVRDALADGRIDLHLQPTVSLPQRKTYYYEGFTRLRDETGKLLSPAQWLPVAERAGLVSAIDNILLFRCVQIVRRLAAKERRVGIFCNVATSSLGDETFFPQFLDFLRENADLAGSLVFEIGHREFADRDAIVARNMSRLADFGFRFSIDKIDTLDLDLMDMKRAGVKFVKAPGSLLVEALRSRRALGIAAAPDLAPQDFGGLLARHGIELVAEKIEDEATVVEVLDLDVAFGQGHLFGPPRPIRDDILEEADARGLQERLRAAAA